MSETAGDMLKRLGKDAMAWAREFAAQYPDLELLGGDMREDATDVLCGWFANAMAMAEREGYDAGMMAQAGLTPPDTSADDTAWDSRNHPDRVAEYVPCDDADLEKLMHPYGSLSEWQPIETAPRDGTRFLGALQVGTNGGPPEWEQAVIWADDETGCVASDCDFGWDIDDLEFWMPLPKAPQ